MSYTNIVNNARHVKKSVAVFQSTNAFTQVYAVPASTEFTVEMIHIINTSALDVTVSLCLVPSAGSPLASNAILWDFEVAANDFIEFMKSDVWPAGSSLQIKASTTAVVNIKISGIEST